VEQGPSVEVLLGGMNGTVPRKGENFGVDKRKQVVLPPGPTVQYVVIRKMLN
jgi:hypothetical protein